MQHKVINCDGYAECYACGITVEFTSDGDTHATFDAVPCRPGGWAHPPYMYAFPETDQGFAETVAPDKTAGRLPYIETCAAHPYSGCDDAAVATAMGQAAPREYAIVASKVVAL